MEGEKLLLGKQSMVMSNDWDLPDTCRHSRHLLAPHLLGAASMNIWDFRATFFFLFLFGLWSRHEHHSTSIEQMIPPGPVLFWTFLL